MFAVMRLEKYGRSAVNGICTERNRTQNDNRNFARSDIDKTATESNITLIECKHFNSEITKQLKDAGVKERPDSIVMIGGLYTASKEFFTKNENYIELTKEEAEAIATGAMEDLRRPDQKIKYLYDDKAKTFFDDCLKFHIEAYCQGDASKVFSAKIDYDETTPHLQVYSTPLEERTNKKGITKMHLCAKNIIGNRSDLRRQQDAFFEKVAKTRGFERGEKVDWELDYSERKKHETTYEHKLAEREALIKSQDAKIKENYELIEKTAKKIEQVAASDKENIERHKRNVERFHKYNEEKSAILEAQSQQIAKNEAIINEQEKAAQKAAEDLRQQQNEAERSKLQLQQQAAAAEALAKSKIKRNGSIFKKEEMPFKMDMKDYQNATSQVSAVNRLLESPIYTPEERKEMQREADAFRAAKRAYEEKSSELDVIIEQRVKERIELLNRTEPERIKQLERQLTRAKNDVSYVVDAIKSYLQDNNLSIKDFERNYGISITDDRKQRHTQTR